MPKPGDQCESCAESVYVNVILFEDDKNRSAVFDFGDSIVHGLYCPACHIFLPAGE